MGPLFLLLINSWVLDSAPIADLPARMRPPPLALRCLAAARFSALPEGRLPPAVVALAPLRLPVSPVLAAEDPAPLGPLAHRIESKSKHAVGQSTTVQCSTVVGVGEMMATV